MSTVRFRRVALLAGVALASGLALVGCSGSSSTSTGASSSAGGDGQIVTESGEPLDELAPPSNSPIPAALPEFEGGTLTSSTVAEDDSYFEVIWTTSDSPADAVTAYSALMEKAGYTSADAYSDSDVAGATFTSSDYVVAVQAYTLDGLTYIGANGSAPAPSS